MNWPMVLFLCQRSTYMVPTGALCYTLKTYHGCLLPPRFLHTCHTPNPSSVFTCTFQWYMFKVWHFMAHKKDIFQSHQYAVARLHAGAFTCFGKHFLLLSDISNSIYTICLVADLDTSLTKICYWFLPASHQSLIHYFNVYVNDCIALYQGSLCKLF